MPHDGDRYALQKVQISVSMVNGHEVMVRAGPLDGATPSIFALMTASSCLPWSSVRFPAA